MQTQELSQAMLDIIAERRRQIAVEGWTPEHDDTHAAGSLARAAAVYAMPSGLREVRTLDGTILSKVWAWDWRHWKPKDRRTDLVRAGALIAAEIEKMDRASARLFGGAK